MKTNDTTRVSGKAMPETRDIGDAIDLLCRAIDMNELMFMASDALSDRTMGNALATCADHIDDVLKDVKAVLYANLDQKGGEA